ncbi:hypothetical protein [Alkalihalobacillus sp. TS-13]|uniref:hypothetical protein n=1 Tax=Alkalihalobacillus sp. TS-13 TaxID=2842455 RepID=UPI001C8855D4|nr:hypothetical protein [Alkalihalobacillus sp. TS-13]
MKSGRIITYSFSFSVRLIFSIGNYFSFFAQSVAAYLFSSALSSVGLLWLIRGIASILLIPIGGLVTDRYNRKRIILTTDLISGMLTLSFFFLTTDNQFWLLPLLAFSTQAVHRLYDPAVKASFKQISYPTPLKKSGAVLFSASFQL